MMRIGVDATCLLKPKLGVAEYTICLLRAMAELRELEFVLLGSSLRHCLDAHLPDLGRAKIQLQSVRFPAIAFRALWAGVRFPPVNWLTGRIDVFHSPNYLVPPIKGTKLVVTVHDLTVLKFPQFHFARRNLEMSIAFRSLGKADRIIAVSENTKRDLLEMLDIPEAKIAVIHNGLNPMFTPITDKDVVSSVLAKYGVRTPYILNVGTLEPRKNQVRLIEAFHLLCQDEAKEHSLVVVGQKGWSYEHIFATVERLHLGSRVIFTGHVPDEDLPPLVNGADVFVYPSLYEGFGFPPLEAMACGIPVITADVSSLPEVVGDAGILVDPYDVTSIAAAIKVVIGDRKVRAELRQKGIERAKLFSWKKAAAQTLEVYDQLLQN